MRRSFRVLLALVFGLALLAPTSAQAGEARPFCGIYWGSLPKQTSTVYSTAPLTNVRTGQHACFDRLVLDVRGDVRSYSVRYVTTVHRPGSGFALPLRGGADLQVIAHVPAYNSQGQATYRPANRNELRDVSGYRTFRQVALAGSFEGQTTLGLGVRARLPFRVFLLDGPGTNSRLVIDVAHRWY